MRENQLAVISGVLTKVPAWVRIDLSSADHALRQRAEETVAAMIAAALACVDDVSAPAEKALR